MNFVSRRAEIGAARASFAQRFLPVPVDGFGSPYPLETAAPLVRKLMARSSTGRGVRPSPTSTSAATSSGADLFASAVAAAAADMPAPMRHVVLAQNPSVITTKEAAKLIGTTAADIESTLEDDVVDMMVTSETRIFNVASVHGARGVMDLCATGRGGADSKFASPTATMLTGRDGQAAPCHRVWHNGRWCVAGCGDVPRAQVWRSQPAVVTGRRGPLAGDMSAEQQQQQHTTATTTTTANDDHHTAVSPPAALADGSPSSPPETLWFAGESAAAQLEELAQREQLTSRMWVTPQALPRNVATDGNRLTLTYALQKRLIAAHSIEPRVPIVNRARLVKPFHFWARTGLRCTFDDAVAAEQFGWIRNCEYFSWFSSLDLKMFGYRVRDNGEPLVRLVERRLVSVVPLVPEFVGDAGLRQLDAMGIPQPPAGESGPTPPVRLLRPDFRWSLIPSPRVEVTGGAGGGGGVDDDDIRRLPLVDHSVLRALGVRPVALPVVLTLRIPVSAYNVMQLVPDESHIGLPPPWMGQA